MTCPICRVNRLVEIRMQLKGAQLSMKRCSRCEARWWDSGGRQVPLEGVLEMAASSRR